MTRLYCTDITQLLGKIELYSVDLIFADPPFNLGIDYGNGKKADKKELYKYMDWCKQWIILCDNVLKNTGSIYIMNTAENIWFIQKILFDLGYNFRNTIIWKNSSIPIKNRYCLYYQPIVFYTKTKEYTFNCKAEERKKTNSVLPYGKENKGRLMVDYWDDIPFISGGCMSSKEAILETTSKKKAHPTQMPIALADRVIKFSSNEGDLVLDPFCGSGTVGVSCSKLNRRYIGCDINKKYVDMAIKRIGISREKIGSEVYHGNFF